MGADSGGQGARCAGARGVGLRGLGLRGVGQSGGEGFRSEGRRMRRRLSAAHTDWAQTDGKRGRPCFYCWGALVYSNPATHHCSDVAHSLASHASQPRTLLPGWHARVPARPQTARNNMQCGKPCTPKEPHTPRGDAASRRVTHQWHIGTRRTRDARFGFSPPPDGHPSALRPLRIR